MRRFRSIIKSQLQVQSKNQSLSLFFSPDSFTPLQGRGEKATSPDWTTKDGGMQVSPTFHESRHRRSGARKSRLRTVPTDRRCDKRCGRCRRLPFDGEVSFHGQPFGRAPRQHGDTLYRAHSFRRSSKVELEVPRRSSSFITVGGEISQITSHEK